MAVNPRDLSLNNVKEPKGAYVVSTVLSMSAVSIISFCFSRRTNSARPWREVPLSRWLILGIYIDSWLFVFSSTILQTGFGLGSSDVVCGAAILLCLVFYLSTKILIYFFLVEKVYIIRSKHKRARRADKLYLFNTLGMILPYGIVICLMFIFRVASLNQQRQCLIGIKLAANIPLLTFDAGINIYLTSLFLTPLIGSYTLDHRNPRLRDIAKRTFLGSVATLASSIANLTTMIIMRGHEPGWLCFACCNADVVFSAIVLHWVTSTDAETQQAEQPRGTRCTTCRHRQTLSRPTKYSTWRSSTLYGDSIWSGEMGERTTEISAGRCKGDACAYSMDGITVRVDHHTEVEMRSDAMISPLPQISGQYNEVAIDDMKINVHENGQHYQI